MKVFFRNSIIIALFSGMFYVLVVCFWGDYMPKELFHTNVNIEYNFATQERLREAGLTKNVSILFLGSSHTYRGFDTRIFSKFGIKTFNLGSSSQTPIQTEILLNRYLKNLNPKFVIYEVNPGMLTSDGIESSLDIIANDKTNENFFQLSKEQNHIKVYNACIYRYYLQIFNKKKYLTSPKNSIDTYIHGGFVERQQSKFDDKFIPKLNTLNYNKMQIRHFETIIHMLAKRKIIVLLIEAPIHSKAYKAYVNHANFEQKIKRYGKYYNFNLNSLFNDSLHFYDSQHLNQNGVKQFNHMVIDTLISIYPKLFGKN